MAPLVISWKTILGVSFGKFKASTKITEEVLSGIRECIDLAPLHNPANLKGIEAVTRLLGAGMPQVAVFDTANGSLLGLVAGTALGPLRTGALGGVAIDTLARADAETLGLVGTGKQARTQLEAACAVRRFTRIRAFSRTETRRREFCREMSETVGVDIEPADSAQQAVSDADVVICSTVSDSPVLEAAWIAAGTHVQNVGPKFRDSSELPAALYERANVLVTDAPAQLADYGDRFLVAGTPDAERVVSLGEVISGAAEGRSDDDQVTLFCSLGLAGTEVALADRLLELAAT